MQRHEKILTEGEEKWYKHRVSPLTKTPKYVRLNKHIILLMQSAKPWFDDGWFAQSSLSFLPVQQIMATSPLSFYFSVDVMYGGF